MNKINLRIKNLKTKNETYITINLYEDIREIIKNELKLQIPKKYIYLRKEDDNHNSNNNDTNKEITEEMTKEEIQNLSTSLFDNDCILFQVIPFELGLFF